MRRPAPAHAGVWAERSGEHRVEMCVADDQLTALVSDKDEADPGRPARRKATVLIDGKTQTVLLSRAADNSVTGSLAAPATGR